MHRAIKVNCSTSLLAGWLILMSVVLTAAHAPALGSELTGGKKALFGEDFELDIYEWTLMEEGEQEGESPNLITTKEAYQGNNALLFSGKKGILGLELTERIKGLVEFPDKFAYAVDGNWQTIQIPVGEGWHTFTYDFSGAFARVYIDGKLITTAEQLHEFDRVRLGVNNGRGGRCLVDNVVVYAVEPELSDENAVEVEIPLLGWEENLKPGRASFDNREWPTCSYSVSEEVSHSGKRSAKISYRPPTAREKVDFDAVYALGAQRYHFRFTRAQRLFGIPRKLTLWIHGDGSGSDLTLLLFGFESEIDPNPRQNNPRVGKIDWHGWRQVTIEFGEAGIANSVFRGFDVKVPEGKAGAIYFDDLVLTTKLNKDFPYVFHVENTAEDGVIDVGAETTFQVLVGNYGQEDKRTSGGRRSGREASILPWLPVKGPWVRC